MPELGIRDLADPFQEATLGEGLELAGAKKAATQHAALTRCGMHFYFFSTL